MAAYRLPASNLTILPSGSKATRICQPLNGGETVGYLKFQKKVSRNAGN